MNNNLIPWLHQLYDNPMYSWVVKNQVMFDPKNGIELRYKARTPEDVICGARTMRPPIIGFTDYPWRQDCSIEHEVVCTILGNHGESPHVGVPAECADMKCECSKHGSFHLVIVGISLGVRV